MIGLTLVSACILVDAEGRVLISKRPSGKVMAGYWEFPGGKVESGETPERALIRELREEIGISTEQNCLAPFCFLNPPDIEGPLVLVYICRVWRGLARPLENQELAWQKPASLYHCKMLPANAPLIGLLQDWL